MRSVLFALLAFLLVLPVLRAADEPTDADKKTAVAAVDVWLGEMDAGDYAKSWSDAAKSFQAALTSEQWVKASESVRKPLGKLVSRKLASALYQEEVPSPNAKPVKGPFVIAQYDASFENLKYARETVTFQKDSDGTWRAAGYYIKPQ
jgi:hypothetical protein